MNQIESVENNKNSKKSKSTNAWRNFKKSAWTCWKENNREPKIIIVKKHKNEIVN